MFVKLLHATPEPDQIVGLAAMVCRSNSIRQTVAEWGSK